MTETPSCPTEQVVANYAAGRLKGQEAEAFERHIETCVECREAMEWVRFHFHSGRPGVDEDGRGATARRLWRWLVSWRDGSQPGQSRWTLWLSLAAVLTGLVVGAWWLWASRPGQPGLPDRRPAAHGTQSSQRALPAHGAVLRALQASRGSFSVKSLHESPPRNIIV